MKTSIKPLALTALFSLLTLVLSPVQAFAWECIDNPNYTGGAFGCSPTACRFQPGNSLTYHLLTGNFTAAEATAINDASVAWEAGTGEINRGANWEFNRGADSASLSLSDGRYDVSSFSDAWFAAMGVPAGAIAVGFKTFGAWPNCGVNGGDIVFRSSVNWTTSLPAGAAAGSTSIGQVAMHEFGHIIGFDHENDDMAVMNSFYPNGGDISASYRINEMDFVGMEDNYSDASTGTNLMISKFVRTGAGTSSEGWTGATVNTSRGAVLAGGNVPGDVLLLITGTSSQSNIRVSWFLRPIGTTCGGATSVLVGSRIASLGVSLPFSTNLTTWTIPNAAASGDYLVCAMIDADNTVAETSETDNTVASDRIYHVQ